MRFDDGACFAPGFGDTASASAFGAEMISRQGLAFSAISFEVNTRASRFSPLYAVEFARLPPALVDYFRMWAMLMP